MFMMGQLGLILARSIAADEPSRDRMNDKGYWYAREMILLRMFLRRRNTIDPGRLPLAKKSKSDEEVADFRARVCKAATRLFLERGAKNVSMRQIAAELGVSAMTPYRYFSGRDEILATVRAAAFNKFASTLEMASKRGADAQARAKSVGDAYVRFAKRYASTYQLMFASIQPDETRYPELAHATARARRTMDDYVQGLVDEGIIHGDVHLIGYMFWAVMHGIVMLDQAGALSRDVNAAMLRQMTFDTLFAGISIAPPLSTKKPPVRKSTPVPPGSARLIVSPQTAELRARRRKSTAAPRP